MKLKKNEENSLKQNNIELITNNEIFNNNQNNKIYTQKENKKVGNMDSKPVSVNFYNATLNSFGQFIQNNNYNQNKGSINSTSQKKLFLKQNTVGLRREDTRTIEAVFN